MGRGADAILTNLFNPTMGRDASHPCLISTWPKEGYIIVCVITEQVSKTTAHRMHYALLSKFTKVVEGKVGFPLKPQNVPFCGRNKSFSNQVLFTLGWVGLTFALTRTNLLNLTSGRDNKGRRRLEWHRLLGPFPKQTIPDWGNNCSSHITHTMVHSSLGQVLIRQGWKASLPDVGLSKTLRIRPTPCATNSKENNTWLGFETKFPPTVTIFNDK